MQKLQPKQFLSSSCMLLSSEMKCFILFATMFAIAVYLVFLSLCLFVFCYCLFFFFIIILLYFILLFFLYLTTHIFVTLIKDYKIYLVAKRPQQGC